MIQREDSSPLDKSQGKHPAASLEPRSQSFEDRGPAHQRYLLSAAGESIYRRSLDQRLLACGTLGGATLGLPRPERHPHGGRSQRAANTAHRLRLCVHINRDNRGSPGAAYRAGVEPRWGGRSERPRETRERPGHPTYRASRHRKREREREREGEGKE